MKLKLVLFTFAACLFASTGLAQGFQGTWNTSFGEVRLFEEYAGNGTQNTVYGTYADRGFILARSNGQTLRGVFIYADQSTGEIDTGRSQFIGTFEWNMTADYQRFNGPWDWGTTIPNGSGQGWTGTYVSDDTPTVDRTRMRRWSFTYALEAGNTINDWMRAVGDLQGAGYSDPNVDLSDALGDFEISVVSGGNGGPPRLNAEQRTATERVRQDNPGLHDDCWIIDVAEPLLRCDLQLPAISATDRLGLQRDIGLEEYPYSKTVYLPMENCLPGSARVEGYYLVCTSLSYYGSYSDSCDAIEIEAQTDIDALTVVTYCSGPRHRLSLGWDSETLFNELGKLVVFYRFPDLLEHSSSEDRPYKSTLHEDYECPTYRLWNNDGLINCSN